MSLKDYINKIKKEDVYTIYANLIKNAKDYKCISRLEMYEEIMKLYKSDPEIILKLCNVEQINLLEKILYNNFSKDKKGYLDYLLLEGLKNNLLIIETEKDYYIPLDLVNYVKMALNLYDEKIYSLQDISESMIIGLIRIYNCLTLEELGNLLKEYFIEVLDLKAYILENYKFKKVMTIKKYQKIEYVISLEYPYYKDVIKLKRKDIILKKYNLDEVISIGKYKINLFSKSIFKFLSFVEVHLDNKYIDYLINEIIVYMGFDLNDENALNIIADNIPELLASIKEVIGYFPIWIYHGNNLASVKENFVKPKKNDLCICGSGKKFKHCCMKYYK